MRKCGGILNHRLAQCVPIAVILTPTIAGSKKSCADFGPCTPAAFRAGTGIRCYLEVIPCKGNTISVYP